LNYVEVGGSTFIRKSKNGKEVNVGRWLPDHPSGKLPVWSPQMAFDVFIVATKDIKAGEEIVRPVQF
jgi:SET domain-containing protein